jgi:quinol monooxygenase YgiN
VMQLTVRLTAASGRAQHLLEALHARKRQCLVSGDCSSAHIAADVDGANVFWYVEDWPDVAALERELSTERFTQLLALLETSVTIPTMEFRFVSAVRGLDYVSEVREARAAGDRQEPADAHRDSEGA